MEFEVRFYYALDKYDYFINLLSNVNKLNNNGRFYEKTIQYNHPSGEYNFYSKEIDGRFRIRKSVGNSSSCRISWKRRLNNVISDINQEEEVEIHIDIKEYDNLMFIINNVLHMKEVESYERYRTIFANNEVEIALDEYPFGLALEIESKGKDFKNIIDKYIKLLKLDYKDSYKLSWDDKYEELCKEQNIIKYKHVLFDKDMPKIEK